jgi:hypothetical protein
LLLLLLLLRMPASDAHLLLLLQLLPLLLLPVPASDAQLLLLLTLLLLLKALLLLLQLTNTCAAAKTSQRILHTTPLHHRTPIALPFACHPFSLAYTLSQAHPTHGCLLQLRPHLMHTCCCCCYNCLCLHLMQNSCCCHLRCCCCCSSSLTHAQLPRRHRPAHHQITQNNTHYTFLGPPTHPLLHTQLHTPP